MSGVKGLDRERLLLEMRRAARPSIWIVLLIVGALVSTGVIFANIGVKLPWADTYEARIEVDDAAGVVAKKQSVRLAGIEVGRIQDVQLEGGRAIVSITLEPDRAPLYRDARLRLRPETPLNDIFLNIERRGTPAAGVLEKGDVLPAERTKVAVDVGRVLNVFNVPTRARLEQTIDAYGRGLGPNGPEFRQTLVELAPFLRAARKLTHETAVRREQTARLVHNYRLVTEELARRDREVRRLVSGGAATLGELGDSEAAVEEVIAELPPTMRQLTSTFTTVRAMADELDPALTELRPVAEALPAGMQALGRLGDQLRPSLAALRRPLPQTRGLLSALRPTARSLRSAFTSLTPVPARLDRVTRLIEPCERAIAKFFQNTISLGKYADQNSVILRGQSIAGQNSISGNDADAGDPNLYAPESCAPGGPRK